MEIVRQGFMKVKEQFNFQIIMDDLPPDKFEALSYYVSTVHAYSSLLNVRCRKRKIRMQAILRDDQVITAGSLAR